MLLLPFTPGLPSFRTQPLECFTPLSMNKWVPEQPSPWRKYYKRKSCYGHSCHILPSQPTLWNKCFPPEPANTAKRSPKSISEGGRIWQVWGSSEPSDASANFIEHYVIVWLCDSLIMRPGVRRPRGGRPEPSIIIMISSILLWVCVYIYIYMLCVYIYIYICI